MCSQAILYSANLILREPTPRDLADRLALGCDAEVVRMFGGDTSIPLPSLSPVEVSRWLDGIKAHPHAWVIEHEGHLLGEARLDGLNEHDRRARLAIGFYDPAKLGQGLGREGVRLVLGYAFQDLRLHRVDARVLAYNVRAIRCYQSCGFIEEGRERESALVDGVWHDDLVIGILSHEYLRSPIPQ